MSTEFKWYASDNGEDYTVGPCDTREQVILEAKQNELGIHKGPDGQWNRLTFEIMEARKANVRYSKHFDAQGFLEDLEESIEDEHADGEHYVTEEQGPTKLQLEELGLAIEALLDQWQDRHKIELEPWTFTQTRNEERVHLDIPLKLAA